MTWSWFDVAFPWIGGVFAVAILILMFATNVLRSAGSSSRWRDPVWISWASVVVYLLHNVEEYGMDLRGQAHSFPANLCAVLGQPPYPGCVIPPAFYLAVNIPIVWIAATLAALMSKRHPLVGFAMLSVTAINLLVHIGATFAGGYNPGLLTAIVLFIPLTVWTGYAFTGKGRLMSYGAFSWLVFWGVPLHLILMMPLFLYVAGKVGFATLISTQLLNGVLLVVVHLLMERRFGLGPAS
jgi:hypothetical protein